MKENKRAGYVKVQSFELFTYREPYEYKDKDGNEQVTMRDGFTIVALGEDGIIYECAGGSWLPLAITQERMRDWPLPMQNRERNEKA